MVVAVDAILSYVCANVWVMRNALDELAEAATSLATRPVYGLSDEMVESIAAAHRITATLTGTLALLVHEASGRVLPKRFDATGTVAWLRDLREAAHRGP